MARARDTKRKGRRDIWPPIWRRRPRLTAVVALIFIAIVWARLAGPIGDDRSRYHDQHFICVRVIDGDTLDINLPDGRHSTTRIRLIGVDTPETQHSERGPMHFGEQASRFTESKVLNRKIHIVLAPQQTRDRYGRLLAYVYFDNEHGESVMLNEALITEGFGYADRRFEHPWKVTFEQKEARAERNGVGLWAEVTPEKMPEWRRRYAR